jgi:hypothetical protein
VRIPKDVLEDLEAVRRYVHAEVLDIPTLRYVAMETNKPALVLWIDKHAQEYGRGRSRRRILPRELLLSRVWDENFGVTPNVAEVYIAYLRKKVDAPGEPKLIRTVRGAGYVLKEA